MQGLSTISSMVVYFFRFCLRKEFLPLRKNLSLTLNDEILIFDPFQTTGDASIENIKPSEWRNFV